MFEYFYPNEYYESTYMIPFERLYEEGFRGIIFDIDNTLVPHGAPADARSIELFDRLKAIGFSITLLSNNGEERVALFNKDVNVNTIHKAGKPGVKGYLKACEMMNTDVDNTVFIGDQIFTDIMGAKKSGMKAIMVKYMNPREEIQIILKRRLEWFVLREFLKSHEMLRG